MLVTTSDPVGKLKALGNNVTYLDTSFGVQWLPGWYTGQSLIPGTDSVFTPPYPYTLSNVSDVKDSVTKYAGNVSMGFTAVNLKTNEPGRFQLYQNYPNPFNPTTTIEYQVSNRSNVKINIYNSNGQLMKVLVNEDRKVGSYSIKWNGRDDKGNLAASGTYFYQIQTGNYLQSRKMILLK